MKIHKKIIVTFSVTLLRQTNEQTSLVHVIYLTEQSPDGDTRAVWSKVVAHWLVCFISTLRHQKTNVDRETKVTPTAVDGPRTFDWLTVVVDWCQWTRHSSTGRRVHSVAIYNVHTRCTHVTIS